MARLSYDHDRVLLDVDVDTALVTDPVVLAARAQYEAAVATLEAAVEALAATEQDEAEERQASASAGASATAEPKGVRTSVYWQAQRDRRERDKRRAAAMAKAAATAYEDALVVSTPTRLAAVAALEAAHAEELDLVGKARAANAKRRSLEALVRTFGHQAAYRSGATPAEGRTLGSALAHYFQAVHRSDKAFSDPSALDRAWALVAEAAASFPAEAYRVDPLNSTEYRDTAASFVRAGARGIETQEARRLRLLAEARRSAS